MSIAQYFLPILFLVKTGSGKKKEKRKKIIVNNTAIC